MSEKELDAAVKRVEMKINEAIDDSTAELKERVKELEQKHATGGALGGNFGMAGGKSFADQITGHEQFKMFRDGQARRVKMTLSGSPLERKNTVVGDDADRTLVQPHRAPGIAADAFRDLRVRDLMPVLSTDSNRIEFSRELAFSNAAAPQAGEGATKAESDIAFELGEADVVTIAHFQQVSRQVLDDQPALQGFLNTRLRYGVQLEEEDQLLNGDGTGNNMSGLFTNANDLTLDVSGLTKVDTLRRAMEALSLNDWRATGMILHPSDWSEIVRIKDGEDRYLFANPQAATQTQLWGVPVVVTNSAPEGDYLVADFDNAGVIWDRQAPVVELFEQDGDDVQRNLVTIRAEMRSTITVMRPAAVVKGSFDAE